MVPVHFENLNENKLAISLSLFGMAKLNHFVIMRFWM